MYHFLVIEMYPSILCMFLFNFIIWLLHIKKISIFLFIMLSGLWSTHNFVTQGYIYSFVRLFVCRKHFVGTINLLFGIGSFPRQDMILILGDAGTWKAKGQSQTAYNPLQSCIVSSLNIAHCAPMIRTWILSCFKAK